MKDGGRWEAQLYLALSDPEFPGRDVERLAGIIRDAGGGRVLRAPQEGES